MPTVESYQKDKNKRKQAYEYFISQGYSPEVASGIVGNLVHESGLNTIIEGDIGYKGGNSQGLAQWRGERLKRLKDKYGDNWNKFENQLEFVDWELKNTHKRAGEKLLDTTTIHEAGQVFSDFYEIPKKKYHENEARRLAVERIGQDFLTQNTTPQQQNINSEQTNFENTNNLSTFEQQPTIHTKIGAGLPNVEDIEEKDTPKEKESTSKEKEVLLQKQKEYQFLQDFLKGDIQKQTKQRRQEQPQPELPQLDPMQEYEQISQFVENPIMQQGGQIPTSRRGVHEYPNQMVNVPSPNIDMQGVDYPILGISQETGEQKVMLPNMQYYFDNSKNVLEIPLIKNNNNE